MLAGMTAMESVDGSKSMMGGGNWAMSIRWAGLEILPTHVLFTTMIALGKCIAAMIIRTAS